MTKAFIESKIESGLVLVISTIYRRTMVDQKALARWKNKGLELFREDSGGSLYMARGKNWDCLDYCELKFYRKGA